MDLAIYWTDFSKRQLKLIFDYYKEQSNKNTAKLIVEEIVSDTEKLKYFPKSGQIEPLLIHLDIDVRYTISQNYKIIYLFNEEMEQIFILDVFDTRQNPETIIRSIV